MRKLSAYVLVGCIIFSTGCANKSLDTLRELERQTEEGLVQVYDEALERQYIERKGVEGQFIDLQSKHTFLINAYIQETGVTPEDLQDSQVFSIAEIDAHNKEFHERKVARWKEIDASYQELRRTIDEKRGLNLAEEIENIEEERDETQKTFLHGLKTLWGLLK